MERKNSIYRVLYYECPVFCELFPARWDISPGRWDFSPSLYLPYVICACRALVVPLVLPFCFVSLVLGVRIRLIMLFLS